MYHDSSLVKSCLMMLVQFVVACIATYLLMALKDSTSFFELFLTEPKKQPKMYKGSQPRGAGASQTARTPSSKSRRR